MLITFRSKVGDITMFGDVAVKLLKMMGQSGASPGALLAADLPPAVARLEQALAARRSAGGGGELPPPSGSQDDAEALVSIAIRAVPLVDLLKRAAQAKADVTWGQ
jgi:Domain of unknown function (DUF1840)